MFVCIKGHIEMFMILLFVASQNYELPLYLVLVIVEWIYSGRLCGGILYINAKSILTYNGVNESHKQCLAVETLHRKIYW